MSGFFINLVLRQAKQKIFLKVMEPHPVELFFPRIFTSKIPHLKCVCQLQIDELVLLNSSRFECLSSLQKVMYQLLNFNHFCFSKIQKLCTVLDLIALGQKQALSEPFDSCELPVWSPIHISLVGPRDLQVWRWFTCMLDNFQDNFQILHHCPWV